VNGTARGCLPAAARCDHQLLIGDRVLCGSALGVFNQRPRAHHFVCFFRSFSAARHCLHYCHPITDVFQPPLTCSMQMRDTLECDNASRALAQARLVGGRSVHQPPLAGWSTR